MPILLFIIIIKKVILICLLFCVHFAFSLVLFDCHCQLLNKIHGRPLTHTRFYQNMYTRSIPEKTYCAQFFLFSFLFCGCATFIYQIRFNGHPPTCYDQFFNLQYTQQFPLIFVVVLMCRSVDRFCNSQKHVYPFS